MSVRRWTNRSLWCLSLAWIALACGQGIAAEAPFYQGKTLTIIEGRAAGGTGSLRVQAVVKYLLKYLPGNPAVQIIGGGSLPPGR